MLFYVLNTNTEDYQNAGKVACACQRIERMPANDPTKSAALLGYCDKIGLRVVEQSELDPDSIEYPEEWSTEDADFAEYFIMSEDDEFIAAIMFVDDEDIAY